jgi:hypothetical protein
MSDDLLEVTDRLRRERAQATPLELDTIKMRTLAGATTSRWKGRPMRSRLVTTGLTLALMAAGTGGVIANGGEGGGKGDDASDAQYKPGKGCGDKNHEHARHDECKNNNSHGSNASGSHQSHRNSGSHGDS